MTKTFRIASLVASAAAVVLTSVPVSAATPTQQATARANIRKPLTIEWQRNLDFGDIVLDTAAFNATVSLTQAGVLACPAPLTCSGTVSSAGYLLRGSANQVVSITAPDVTLTSGGNTLVLAVDAPATVTLSNSGVPGDPFGIGGSIDLSEATPDGLYTGTFAVTAEYQ